MIAVEPLHVDQHAALLHAWVTHPRSVYWQMQDATPADVARDYALVADSPHHDAFLGRVDGTPVFLAETYDPAHSELAGASELRAGDLGMHLLVAPTEQPVAGFTRRIFAAVMTHCFTDPAVRRVVVEPDVRNTRIATLNVEAGFRVVREMPLHGKTAALSFATRADWDHSTLGGAA
ncbi:MAG: acetyltransferase [Nocardioides sp.]|nr:acetyltransferase [Nocardioides sp.]